MSALAFLFWPAYLLAALWIFRFCAQESRPPSQRWEYYMLGLALMMLAMGRMLYAFDPSALSTFSWIFDCAHVAMLSFVALKILNARRKGNLS